MGNKLCIKKKPKKLNTDNFFDENIFKTNKSDDYFNEKELEYYEKEYESSKTSNIKIKKNLNIKEGRILGTGAYGTVIFGLDCNTGLMLAIKTLFLQNNQDGKSKWMEIEREVDLLSEWNHKNIVKYIGSEKTDNKLKIYWEYVEGGNLSKNISTFHPLNENIVRYYSKQILEGLEYLHIHNVVHMDIKGSNIWLDKNGICKLADFGTSKKLCGLTLKTFKGTLNYMAPEVMKQTGYGRYADIWSFGCTVYQMFTAKEPWHDIKTYPEMFHKVINTNEIPPFPQTLSLEAKDFLYECLQKDIKKRPNVYKLLRHPFILGKKILNDIAFEHKAINISTNKRDKPKKNIDELNYKKSLNKLKKTLNINKESLKKREINSQKNPRLIKKFDFDIEIKTSLIDKKWRNKKFDFINEILSEEEENEIKISKKPKPKKSVKAKIDPDKTLHKIIYDESNFKLNISSSKSDYNDLSLSNVLNNKKYEENQYIYYDLKNRNKNKNLITMGQINKS